jgi:hypothetical protein
MSTHFCINGEVAHPNSCKMKFLLIGVAKEAVVEHVDPPFSFLGNRKL